MTTSDLYKQICQKTDQILPHITQLRRRLHQHPEPAFEEMRTTEIIYSELDIIGLDPQELPMGIGVIARIQGNTPGPTRMLRADIDCVPICDHSDTDWASAQPGFSHACGHDGHTACLLGAAHILHRLRQHIEGNVILLFQPGEESGEGAKRVMESGILTKGDFDAAITLHAWPGTPVGSVAARPGCITANNDSFALTLNGLSGHGARPHLARSPITAAAELTTALSALTHYPEPSGEHAVVSLGKLHSGFSCNIIPDTALLEGTVRTLAETSRQSIHDTIRSIVHETCQRHQLEYDLDLARKCDSVKNAPFLYKLFVETAADLLPTGDLLSLVEGSMGAEDFSYYLQYAPGFLFRLGVGEKSAQLHNSCFDFNDNALPAGISMLTGLGLNSKMLRREHSA